MQRINEDIKTGNFKQIYLLYGEERYLKNQYTTRLRKALCQDGDEMNTHFYQGKDFSLGQVIDLAETLPFLAERRVMFFKDTGLFKSGGEKLAEYLASPNDTTFFVFTESEVEEAPEEDVLETDDLRKLDAVEEQKKADPDDIFVEEDGGDEEKADDGEKTE